MTTAAPRRTRNPYVGPTAFRAGDPLYGRANARDELLDLLVAERIVLLYSPSGAGKTSLIQAVLVAALEDAGFEVLPVVRVTHAVETGAPAAPTYNRYVMSTLLSLEEGVPTDLQRPVTELAGMRLAEYLDSRPDLDGRPGNEVLVFDQFEEVLTADPTDAAQKQEFFTQLGEALRDRHHWALFAMREDFLAALDPYLRYIPTRFRTRYRLDLLTADQALEAVMRPAADAGVEFSPEAARDLVDDLRRVRVQRPDGTATVLGHHVEPVQLQVACHLLWSRLPADATEITVTDGTALGGVEEALAGYYASSVQEAARRAGVPESAVRDWFDQQLITTQGLRGQVLDGPLESEQANRALLHELVSAHLVRAESRRHATWYELAHDRFIEPVRRDNAAWRSGHLTPFEWSALQWDQEGRPDRLLLTGPALADAERWLSRPGVVLNARERRFLDASRRAEVRRRREVRDAARMRRLVRWLAAACVVAVVLMGTAGVFLGLALHSANEAATSASEAVTKSGLLDLQQQLVWDPESGVANAAALADDAVEPLDEHLRDALYLAAGATPLTVAFQGHERTPWGAALSLDGSTVVTSDAAAVHVWDRATGAHRDTVQASSDVYGVHVSDDGRVVAAALADGGLLAWDTTSRGSTTMDTGGDVTWSVAISPDGAFAAAVTTSTVEVWDIRSETLIHELSEPGTSPWGASFSPDGSMLATVSVGDGVTAVVVHDARTGHELARFDPGGPSFQVQFGEDPSLLGTIGADMSATVWDWTTGRHVHPPLPAADLVYRSFNGDLSQILSVSPEAVVAVDTATGEEVARVHVEGAELVAAGFDPQDDTQVLVLPRIGDASMWRLGPAHQLQEATVEEDRVWSTWDDGATRVLELDGRWSTVPAVVDARDTVRQVGARGLAAVATDGGVAVHDVRTGATEFALPGGERLFDHVAVLPGGRGIVTSEAVVADRERPASGVRTPETRLTLWDPSDGRLVSELALLDHTIESLAVSPSGSHVVAIPRFGGLSAPESDVVLMALDGGDPVPLSLPWDDHGWTRVPVTAAGLTEDGTRVALANGSELVGVFDTSTGDAVWWHTVSGRTDRVPVQDLAFTSDGSLLVVGESEALLLDAETGSLRRNVLFRTGIADAALTSDGRHLAAVTRPTGSVVVVPLDDGELIRTVRERVVRPATR